MFTMAEALKGAGITPESYAGLTPPAPPSAQDASASAAGVPPAPGPTAAPVAAIQPPTAQAAPQAAPQTAPAAPTATPQATAAPKPGFGQRVAQLMDKNIGPNEPGGWAKSILASAQQALADISTTPTNQPTSKAGSFIEGLAQTAANQQNRVQAQKQQGIENNQKQQKLDQDKLQSESVIAYNNAQRIHTERLTHQLGDQEIQQNITNDSAYKAQLEREHATPLYQDKTYSEILQIMSKMKGHEDNHPIAQIPIATGRRVVGETTDENGNKVPDYATTYSLYSAPTKDKLTAEMADDLNKYTNPATPYHEGDEMFGHQLDTLATLAKSKRADEAAVKKSITDNLQSDESAKILKERAEPKFSQAFHDALVRIPNGYNHPDKIVEELNRNGIQDAAQLVASQYGGQPAIDAIIENQTKKEIEQAKLQAAQTGIPEDAAGLHGEEFIGKLPSSVQDTVRDIGAGLVPTPATMFRSKDGMKLLNQVTQAYPGFDPSQADAYSKARVKFTSGKEAAGVNALNTVLAHLDRMNTRLSTTSILGGDAVGVTGSIEKAFGGGPMRELEVQQQAVATELAKAYANGQISEKEVDDWKDRLKPSGFGMTRDKLRQNIVEVANLLDGKLNAYQNQWNSAVPQYLQRVPGAVAQVQIISPDAKAARNRILGSGVPSGNVTVQLSNGQTGHIPQENLSQFLQDNPGSKQVKQ